MATRIYLMKKVTRKTPPKWNKTPALKKNPQKRGICIRIFTMSPRKPNSAQRKVAKVRLCNEKKIFAYICGIGHKLQEHNLVLVRGGRVKDLPGVKYHLIRGKFDFEGLLFRETSRSKYAAKKRVTISQEQAAAFLDKLNSKKK